MPSAQELLARPEVPDRVRELFKTQPPDDAKEGWSGALWELECELAEVGFTPAETLVVARDSACNKYERDGRPIGDLWKDVCKATAYVAEEAAKDAGILNEAVEAIAFIRRQRNPKRMLWSVLAKREQVAIVAEPGTGKSTWIDTTGVQGACGIDPITYTPIEPVQFLKVDLENDPEHIQDELEILFTIAGNLYDPSTGLFKVICRPEGLDLVSSKQDRRWLQTQIALNISPERGSILAIGPYDKFMTGDYDKPGPAKEVNSYFATLRREYNFAIIFEAHPPNEITTRDGRTLSIERPSNSAFFKRHVEFGFFLRSDGEFRTFRGNRNRRRPWPERYRIGDPERSEWPWMVDNRKEVREIVLRANLRTPTWRKMAAWIAANGVPKSDTALATAIDVGQPAVSRNRQANADEYARLCRLVSGHSDPS